MEHEGTQHIETEHLILKRFTLEYIKGYLTIKEKNFKQDSQVQ